MFNIYMYIFVHYQFDKTKTYLENVGFVNFFSGVFFCQILNNFSVKPIAALIPVDLIREGMVRKISILP